MGGVKGFTGKFCVFWIGLVLWGPSALSGQLQCADFLSQPRENSTARTPAESTLGALFLHQRNSNLHKAPEVLHRAEQLQQAGRALPNEPTLKIQAWMELLEQTHLGHADDPAVIQRLKSYYFKNYLIEFSDVPESYFEHQRQLARELGHGQILLTQQMKGELAQHLIADQQQSLDVWLDYFLSPDSAHYPMWMKYWSFHGVLKLGAFDPDKGQFQKRSRGTVSPFAELNREALAYVLDEVLELFGAASPADLKSSEVMGQLEGGNFGVLYAKALLKASKATQNVSSPEGRWVQFEQNSSAAPLAASLQGKNTGWCTAGIATAATQLQQGDFHIYYTKDEAGNFSIPRIAIRMSGDRIAEIRGTALNQNLDSQIAATGVLEQKLLEFGQEGDLYLKRSAHMKYLTEIERKHLSKEPLSKEEIRFLYEMDETIEGFGYQRDPRVAEIRRARSLKADLSVLFDVRQTQVSLSKEEALSGEMKLHYGYLRLEKVASGLQLPDRVEGDVQISFSTGSPRGVTLPKIISGSLLLEGLSTAEGLKLPEFIGEELRIDSLTSAAGLDLSNSSMQSLSLRGLTSAESLTLPESLVGSLSLGVSSAADLVLPHTLGGDLDLRNLTSAKELKLPTRLGGGLNLSSLTRADDLKLPESVPGHLYLGGLVTSEGLVLPKSVGGTLYLNDLSAAPGLKFPDELGKDLILSRLNSVVGLSLPSTLPGQLDLRSLGSAQGLRLPEYIGGGLNLSGLKSASGLNLSNQWGAGGWLYLWGLKSGKGLRLPEVLEVNVDLNGLTSASGMTLPKTLLGSLNMKVLTSAADLILPEKISGSLDLRGLTSSEGLVLPGVVGGDIYLSSLPAGTEDTLPTPDEVGGRIYISRPPPQGTDVDFFWRQLGGGLGPL